MSTKILVKVLEAIIASNKDEAEKEFNNYVNSKANLSIFEDHEKYMSAKELADYLKKLHKMAKTEHKEEFAKHLELEECTDATFDECAKILAKDKKKTDKVIHKLEKLVGHKIDPRKYVKETADIVPRSSLPNVFKNNKFKKTTKVPKAKKSTYGGIGIGMPDGDTSSDGSSGADGGE